MILIVITKQSKARSQQLSLTSRLAMSLVSGLREHPQKVHYSSFQITTGLYRPVSWQQANDIGLVVGVNGCSRVGSGSVADVDHNNESAAAF